MSDARALQRWASEVASGGVTAGGVAAAVALCLAEQQGLPVDGRAPVLVRRAIDSDLRLPAGIEADPWALGRAYESALDGVSRKAGGVHFTALGVARKLSAIALENSSSNAIVCDPAAGGGAFLLAAADVLHAGGGSRHDIVTNQLWGIDIDPAVIAVAEAALSLWASTEGVWVGPGGHLVCADALEAGGDAFTGRGPTFGFDAVVGNPPFQNQLTGVTARSAAASRRLRARWAAPGAGAYADTAAYFILVALELVAPEGRVVLVQPESTLVAADAAAVRASIEERGSVDGIWFGDDAIFDANVRVCALSIDGPGRAGSAGGRTRRWDGVEVAPRSGLVATTGQRTWSGLLAERMDVPTVAVHPRAGVLGSTCTATAGFRDQFYGLAPHTFEAEADQGGPGVVEAPLVTVGMIDPLRCRWGSASFRYAGQRWSRPAIDLGSLADADPKLASWVEDRRVPKVLVATQTKVIEVIVDEVGSMVPSTPVVAVHADPDWLWHLAAALSSPVASALAMRRVAGAGLSADAIKLSARQLLELPRPVLSDPWDRGADEARRAASAVDGEQWRGAMHALGRTMIAAAGIVDGADELFSWWWERLGEMR